MTNQYRDTKRFRDAVPLGTAILGRAVELELVQPDVDWDTRDAEVAAIRQAARDAEDRDRAAKRVQSARDAGFPRRAVDAATNARETKAVGRMRNWQPSADRNAIVLLGASGAGKTVAATWWALQRAQAPTFVRASTFAAASRYDREERGAWLSSSALVLDDLGAEFVDAKGSFLTDLDELIDVFYGDGRPLVITTNIPTRAEFETRYQNRIADRLRECAVFFGSDDKSMRGPVAP